MLKVYTRYKLVFIITLLLCSIAQAQVATTYTFSQATGTYTPLVATYPSTPANIFSTSWDDDSYTGYTLPFDFFYNGILYPAGTIIGLDTDAWFAFNAGTITGQLSGGSWVSATVSNGMYLSGNANNNGFAGINIDHWYQNFTSITGNLTTGSNIVTGVSSLTNIKVGTRLTGNDNIPDGTVVIAVGSGQFTMSSNATGTSPSASITPAASIFAMTRGTAPNRQFVIQWTQTKRYSGADNDNFSFQMILEEAPPQQLKVIYGPISTDVTTDLLSQVGLRGNSSADFNARTSAGNWAATTASAANTNTVALKKTNVPASGLTFIWTPVCPAMSTPGSITGASPVCPGTTQSYSIPAVAGATYYTWSYSGTGATFTSASTAAPNNNVTFATNATSGTLTVKPGNACVGVGTSTTKAITITAVTPASISYPSGSSYCTSNAPVSVTQTGPSGGVYSVSPSGLTINTSTGQVTPATSSTGTYTVFYTYSNSGCASLTATTSVTIKPVVSVSTSATPGTVCGSGNAQLTAIADGGANYAVSSIAHNLLTPSGSPTIIWNTTTDDAVSSAIALPFAFNYFGQNITQFTVSSNGFIEMGGASGLNATIPQTLPDAGTPNNVIALTWRDLKVDLAANPAAYVRYFVNGTAPNRVMVVEYNGISFYNISSGTGNVTGQIRLYESDSHIEIHVTANDGGLNLSKTLGIENSTGTIGLTPPGRNNVVWNAITPEGWSFSLSNYTYSWSPSAFLSSTSIFNPVAVNINVSTNYTVTVTNSLTGCSSNATANVLYANTQILSSNGAARCGTGALSLTATANTGNIINWYTASSGGSPVATGSPFNTSSLATTTTYYVSAEATGAGATAIVGTGATTPSSYEGVFDHFYGGNQTQFLVRASELYAAGLRSGNITQLGIRFLSIASQTYNGFAISMLQTANTDMSAGLNTGVFTGVYSAASVTPAVSINTYTLSTPFNWDGTSNIIIKMCWSNNNSGGTDNYAQVDATSYTSCAYYRADAQTPAAICGATTASGSISSRPQFYFTGTAVYCSSARTAVTATVNPQPSAISMSPASVTMCSADAAVPLTFTGGTYPGGTANAYTQGFETFPAADFGVSGGGVTAATNTTYYAEGTKSVRLTHNNNLTTASTTNSYRQTTSLNLSTYTSATLSFKHICALEGSGSFTYDAGYVQYSTDGGGNWTTFPSAAYTGSGTLMTTVNGSTVTGTIFSTRSYSDWNTQFSSSTSNPGTGPATALWKTENITIPPAALNNNFRIRFMITSDGTTQYYGWLIDDVKVIVPGTVTASMVWTPNGTGSGLYTDAAASILYTGSAATTVYAKPSATTTFTATGTAAGGCTATNTVAVTVKPSYTWLGVNANWSDAQNWCPGVPGITNDVIINTGVPFMPVLSSGTGTVKNLTINTGATLTVSSATMQIAGTITTASAGSIDATAGTIELAGSATQAISGSSFANRSIRNLKASNSINVSSAANDSLKITGVLSFGNVNSKTFNSGNNIILASTATGTAMIADITNNNANSGNSFTGSFQVNRYIPARRAWRLMTAPLAAGAQTINQAWQESTAGNWALNPVPGYGTHITGGPLRNTTQGYDQGPFNPSIYGRTATGWNYLPATTGELISSNQGWMLFIRGSRAINLPASNPATVPDVTILRPKGPIKFGVQPTLTNSTGGYIVVGNPYPAPINFKNIGRTGVIGGLGGNNAYLLWDPALGGSSGVGAFVAFAWNGSTYVKSIAVGTGPSNIGTNGMIPSSAAFMVNQSAGGTIDMEETDKDTVVYTNSYLFRPIGNGIESSLRISLYGTEAEGTVGIDDGALIVFNDASSTAVDHEDVIKLNNIKENFAIIKDNKKIAIEFRNSLQVNDTLFYRMWNMRQRHYEFEIALTNIELPANTIALLEDTYLQLKMPLGLTDTNRVGFDITGDTASAAMDRFRIIIAPATVVPVTFADIKAYETGKDIMVEWAVQNELNIVHYEVEKSVDGVSFNAIGNVTARGGNASYNLLDENPVEGTNYYRIKSVDNAGNFKYSRIVKVITGKGKPSIAVYPNPVTDGIINVIFNNMKPGLYTAKLYNSVGQLIFEKQVMNNESNTAEAIITGKKMAKGVYQLEVINRDGNKKVFKLMVE